MSAQWTGPDWERGYVVAPSGDLAIATTDAQLEAYIEKHADTVWHAVGTAMMSTRGVVEGTMLWRHPCSHSTSTYTQFSMFALYPFSFPHELSQDIPDLHTAPSRLVDWIE